jgi:Ca-activated chloride channel family protein
VNTFALVHPWLLALLPLPLLVWWLAPPYRAPRRGLVVPFLPRLAALAGQRAAARAVAPGSLWRLLVLALCWACAVLALARPQVIEPPITKTVPVRDLLLAVDLSGSMATADFTDASGQGEERLRAVKAVLDEFLSRRQGDRVGLVFFGSAAFVQAPFTEDLEVCRELLDEAQVGMAGPQTAFGDALGLAINVFEGSTVRERVLIALTDGNDTASQVPPDKAAQIARDKGIVIHTVAVGDPRAAGEDALDEVTLKAVASSTGGLYSHAADRRQLEAIYAQLDSIETRQADTISHRPRRDVYWMPLAAALLLSMSHFALALLREGWRGGAVADRGKLAAISAVGALAAFHFIRPGWLLALLPAALLWWLLRRIAARENWRGIVAPHLLAHLWADEGRRMRFGPLECLGLAWLLAILAIAGPTWRHEPSPFADETAAIAVVVAVTPSMETADLAPSRLQRAMQKVHDLLAVRGTAKTALVAYAQTAHVVMPATSDAGIIDTFAQALDPEIMPLSDNVGGSGDAAAAALALADQSLAKAGGGSIVWITDGVTPEEADALARWRQHSDTPLRLWPPLLPGAELTALESNTRAAGADLVRFAADDSDVAAIARAAKFAPMQGDDANTRWAESGYWLSPAIALLLLVFFRRGWAVRVGAAA